MRKPRLTPGPVRATLGFPFPPGCSSRMQKPSMQAQSPSQTADFDPAALVDALARTARKVRTPCADGTMVWRVWGAGEPVLLFHGGSGSWTHWIRNIPELSKHYELWVVDIPGLGDSAMPPQPWVPQSIAEVVVAGIDQLFAKDAKLRMAGFSFGGQIAGLSAAMLGDRVCMLTLIGVAALGLRADPREPFAKQRPGMSPAEIAAVFHQNLAVLMFADPPTSTRWRFTCKARTSSGPASAAAPSPPPTTLRARSSTSQPGSRRSGGAATSSPGRRSTCAWRSCAGITPSSTFASSKEPVTG